MMFESDQSVIKHALLMWRNWIETNNVVISAQDALNMDEKKLIRPLDPEQREFVQRLEKLALSTFVVHHHLPKVAGKVLSDSTDRKSQVDYLWLPTGCSF